MMRRFLPLLLVFLAACETVPAPGAPSSPPGQAQSASGAGQAPRIDRAARQFIDVARAVEPVAERQCRELTQGVNCDYLIVVDDRPGQPANAFQTTDRAGRPIIAFTLGLILEAHNADELAFVMGHESAHHVLGHLDRIEEDAAMGAIIFSGIAALYGADAQGVRNAEELGAAVGARSYSKTYELEADELGTIITHRAGYDPIRGAAFFTRIPDPGNRFLGTHPPNSQRVDIVRRTVARLNGGA